MSGLNAALAGVSQQLQSARNRDPSASPAPAAADGDGGDDEQEDEQKQRRDAGGQSGGGDQDDDDGGDDAPIQVFCRIRPSRGGAASKSVLAVDPHEKKVEFNLAKATDTAHTINNTRDSFKFHFNGLFDDTASQADVFEVVGKKVLDNVTRGYNGTIFAYGQTGSGKTFSMMGGTAKYEDRGLIPRSLTYLFEWIDSVSSELSVQLRVSYLEIYGDKGYDLLDPAHEHTSLEQLPRVTLLEGDRGELRFKNLGELPAASIDEALNLLFVGDTNRIVAITPSNDQSTRSHCIFMISLECRSKTGDGKVRRSKLNLVDLAGSERIKKTGVGGKLRNEAVHINVSLHYLEQVIVALHEAARQGGGTTHIPYRNSMLTSVLRDSLGGNCRTIMLACLSFELAHLDESISTSRFAQRVAAIKNKALVNEEVDPYVMVKQLKAQLREARDELAVARGDAQARFRELDEEERSGCVSLVRAFLQDDRDKRYFDEDASGKFVSIPMPNPYRVRACFEAFKEAWKAQGNNGALNAVAAGTVPTTTANAAAAPGAGGDKAMAAEVARLQRENAALLDALRQATGSSAADAVLADARRANGAGAGGGAGGTTRSTDLERPRERNNREQQHRSSAASSSIAASAAAAVAAAPSPAAATPVPAPSPPTAEELALSRARAESFEVFRRSYRKQLLIEEQKATHASKVDLARRTGESINKLRNDINEAKAKIEAHRLARGVAALAEGGGGGAGDTDPASAPPDATELSLLSSIDALKSRYRSEFSSLKDLKAEIDFLKQVVEKSRARLQADFERWWATQPQGMQEAHNKERAAAEAAAAARRPSPDPEENYIAAQRQQQQQQRDEPPASSRSNAASGRPSSARQGPPPVSSSSLSSNAAAAPRFMSDAAAIAASASALPASAGGGSRSRTTAASSPPAQPYEAWGQQQQSQAQSSVSGGRSSGFNGIAASPAATLPGGLHTTGNSSADADIATFYALKQQMLAQRQQQQQQQQQQ